MGMRADLKEMKWWHYSKSHSLSDPIELEYGVSTL